MSQLNLWSKKEDKFVIDFWDGLEPIEIANELKRPIETIIDRARSLGLTNNLSVLTSPNPSKKSGRGQLWTNQEETYLRENWTTNLVSVLAKHLGRSEGSVFGKAIHMGLPNDKTRKESLPGAWVEQDDQYLKYNWALLPIKLMAIHLNRSYHQVKVRARRLGLKKTKEDLLSTSRTQTTGEVTFYRTRRWTDADHQYLVDNWPVMRVIDMAKHLERSVDVVMQKGYALKLTKTAEAKRALYGKTFWSDEDDKYIKNNWHLTTVLSITKHLGKPKESVQKRAKTLGLFAKTDDINSVDHWTIEQEQYLLNVYRKLPLTEIASALNRTALAVKTKAERLLKKAKMPVVCEKKDKGKVLFWSAEEDAYLQQHYSGKSVRQLAKDLGRGTSGVTCRCRLLNLKKTKEDLQKLLTSPSAMPDTYVLHQITHDPVLKRELLKYPNVIQLKRMTIALNRKINQL